MTKEEARNFYLRASEWLEKLERDEFDDLGLNGDAQNICDIMREFGLCPHALNHHMTEKEWQRFRREQLNGIVRDRQKD